MTLTRRTFLTAASLPLAAPALAFGAAPTVTLHGAAFSTGWSVTLPAGRDPERLRAPLVALLAEVDRQVSPWRADSEVARFNAAGAGRIRVSPETAAVAQAALALAADSGGAFDPSVGPLVARWGFGPIATGETGWPGLSAEGDALAKTRAGLTLDLCGIAKGRALDRMADLVADRGERDVLLDLGGELRAFGRHPSGRVWRVGVEDPRPEVEGLAATLALDGMAVATSGLRTNGFDFAGHRIGHIIDPHRAAPADGRLASVSALAGTAMLADGWATALFAAGATGGPALARRHGLSALFLFRDGAGLSRIATGSMDEAL